MTATITDLTVPAPGLPIQIQRTYDSLVRSTSSDFGYGWSLGVNIQTQISPTGDVTLTINGKARTFYFTPPANGVFTLLVHAANTRPNQVCMDRCRIPATTAMACSAVGNVWECAINNSGQSLSGDRLSVHRRLRPHLHAGRRWNAAIGPGSEQQHTDDHAERDHEFERTQRALRARLTRPNHPDHGHAGQPLSIRLRRNGNLASVTYPASRRRRSINTTLLTC